MFWISVAVAAAFVVLGVFATDTFNDALGVVVDHIIDGLGWLYLLITTGFLAFVLWLAFSRYGSIRLGRDGENPEFGLFSWFAMLFQAGMGIGLLFWGVSEPVLHTVQPPLGLEQARTPDAAALSIQYSFFHWGLHPWAVYAVVGLAVGYFSYRRGANSLRISAVLRPLLGDRVDGGVGQAVDVLAVLATLFGIAVSLGAGTLQIEAGLSQAFGAPEGLGVQLGIMGVTAAAYMLSAATPLERGIRSLSNLSMVVAVMLLGYFLVVGPTVLELNTMTQGLGDYASGLVGMSLRTSAFDPTGWLGEWTIFFWATWIAWAPYVGAFIARSLAGVRSASSLSASCGATVFSVLVRRLRRRGIDATAPRTAPSRGQPTRTRPAACSLHRAVPPSRPDLGCHHLPRVDLLRRGRRRGDGRARQHVLSG